jgi:hypothetical protein
VRVFGAVSGGVEYSIIKKLLVAAKKVRITVEFNGQSFQPNTATVEKSAALAGFLYGDVPTVRIWSSGDLFTGADGALSYLTWVNLKLHPNGAYQFANDLARNATFTPTFENFTDFESLTFQWDSNKVVVHGKLAMKLSVKDVVYQDVLNSELLCFSSFGFRPKGSSDILEFTKYGADWTTEREDLERYSEGTDKVFLENAAEVKVLKG